MKKNVNTIYDIPDRKLFDGHYYVKGGITRHKASAEDAAKSLRNKGYFARIVVYKLPNPVYVVYKRKKK